MFGDIMGMMGKLKEAQQEAEEVKKRMDSVYVTGESTDGHVKVVISANKQVKDVSIAEHLLADKEELTDLLVVALNHGLEKAGTFAERETKAAMKDMLPPGLDGFMK